MYFEPQYPEFSPRTMWSLSNAFTSAFKSSEPKYHSAGIPKFAVGHAHFSATHRIAQIKSPLCPILAVPAGKLLWPPLCRVLAYRYVAKS